MSFNIFNPTYFTGAQAQIYIGDQPVSEIISIQGGYSMGQVPSYGYASVHFDAVAPGRAIASGSFVVNYVTQGYLLAYINNFNKQKDSFDNAKQQSSSAPQSNPALPGPRKNEYYQALDNMLKEQQQLQEMLYASDAYIQQMRDTYWNAAPSSMIHPEFAGPFDIKIKDFRIGSLDLNDKNSFEEKIIKDVFITNKDTGRSTDGQQAVEAYSFIGKLII